MRTILATFIAISTFASVLVLMLWINNWGENTPNDAQQMFWAFNLICWPFITFSVIRGRTF